MATSPPKAPMAVPAREIDKPLSAQLRRRFYTTATVGAAEGGFTLLLDGKAVHTPGKRPLVVPTKGLAEAMAGEWAGQGETIEPDSMPLTQLANTAIDRMAAARPALEEDLLRYGGSDLLCYRAERPRELVERQHRAWQPALDWLAAHAGADLVVTSGLMPIDQPETALEALGRLVRAYDDWTLTAVQAATAACGSLVLALALIEGRISAEEAFTLAFLDDSYQMEQWGEDAEAVARRDHLRDEILAVGRFLVLLDRG
ncbi:ATP12 family chaperone protein [Rhodospirillum rubrum]|uniref:ATP12 ATPase n=1 Tax=Rhodospirillum rubrum (strain ATCC 11170 / ATH 1.1.1 / DSM 467 / LMG 4362 / NCIMB 8255 / S1) TaxID=269796 RepID=Q2RQZ2_RHORT|nr:ATP12 family protein [Rhodospirillum rubrum]ABC23453.1 ATP12 ATPase [Rhodospirillum rubrum ATCC 11170]AEO49191.1 ATP12 ATPase [Rhodospirillum rubrum F11]MBK5955123.1 ATPase [Rhodospirillum rubrum]QXG79424.1 ATPase [Rhodospirillum rubrum]